MSSKYFKHGLDHMTEEEKVKQVKAVLKKHLGGANVEKAMKALSELSELQVACQEEYEAKNDAWWNGLTENEREEAFYAVCKRIYQADLIDRGSFRWALYDVFGFGPGMYAPGMDCGYMSIHNTLYDGVDYQKMKVVNRVEVIDGEGRSYSKNLSPGEGVKFDLQDNDKTLKIFIDDKGWRNAT